MPDILTAEEFDLINRGFVIRIILTCALLCLNI
uniref:Uncharacterized protein n=1 Tax=viral metagenome TaxID=1070528 RepID=A0A6C0ECX6_9ZZZZ